MGIDNPGLDLVGSDPTRQEEAIAKFKDFQKSRYLEKRMENYSKRIASFTLLGVLHVEPWLELDRNGVLSVEQGRTPIWRLALSARTTFVPFGPRVNVNEPVEPGVNITRDLVFECQEDAQSFVDYALETIRKRFDDTDSGNASE